MNHSSVCESAERLNAQAIEAAPNEQEPLCWLNGLVQRASESRIPVLDHGLLYGDGVFEGVRFYAGRLFKMREHLERLWDSARVLQLNVPYSMEELEAAAEQLMAASQWQNGYLRIVVTRGEGSMGIDPRSCPRPNVFLIVGQISVVSDEIRQRGAKVVIAATRRLAPDGLDPRIKSLNYLNHILARMEANVAGADEAILLNAAGRVAEGSADNVFIVKRGELLTPPVIEGALAGITRQTIIDLANSLGLPCRETPIAPYDLFTAEECFLTGTGAELIPVASVDGRVVGEVNGPITLALTKAYTQLTMNNR